jgi:hypothetical protein
MLYPRLLDLSTASTDPVTRIFTRLSSLAVRKRINTKGSSDQQPAKELEKFIRQRIKGGNINWDENLHQYQTVFLWPVI